MHVKDPHPPSVFSDPNRRTQPQAVQNSKLKFRIFENLLQRLSEFSCFGTFFELQFPILHLFFRLIMNGSLIWVLSEFLCSFMQLPCSSDLYAVPPQSNLAKTHQ